MPPTPSGIEIIDQTIINEGIISDLIGIFSGMTRSITAIEPIIFVEFAILGAIGGLIGCLLMGGKAGQLELPHRTDGRIDLGFISEVLFGAVFGIFLAAVPTLPSVSAIITGTIAGSLLLAFSGKILARMEG